MKTDVGWTAVQWPGLEHAIVSADTDGWRADGRVIMAEERLVSIAYEVRCDAGFRVTRLTVSVTEAASETLLELAANGDGHWQVSGQHRPDLDGCVDVDINCTPVTNTLPIRRLEWSAGQTHDLDIVYVSVPELSVRPVRQRYTLLARDEPGDRSEGRERDERSDDEMRDQAVFRYESGSFRADLRVDSDGLVLDYPGIWQRIGTGS
jgi:hypothetical protein